MSNRQNASKEFNNILPCLIQHECECVRVCVLWICWWQWSLGHVSHQPTTEAYNYEWMRRWYAFVWGKLSTHWPPSVVIKFKTQWAIEKHMSLSTIKIDDSCASRWTFLFCKNYVVSESWKTAVTVNIEWRKRAKGDHFISRVVQMMHGGNSRIGKMASYDSI